MLHVCLGNGIHLVQNRRAILELNVPLILPSDLFWILKAYLEREREKGLGFYSSTPKGSRQSLITRKSDSFQEIYGNTSTFEIRRNFYRAKKKKRTEQYNAVSDLTDTCRKIIFISCGQFRLFVTVREKQVIRSHCRRKRERERKRGGSKLKRKSPSVQIYGKSWQCMMSRR